MKRPALLIFAIIFSLLALVVLGYLIASLSGRVNMGSFSIGELTAGELIKEEKFNASDVDKLRLSTGDQKIMFYLTNDDFITVRQLDYSDAEPFTAEQENGALEITLDTKLRIMIMNFTMPVLEVYLPHSYAGSVTAHASSGGVRCDDAVAWSDVDIESSSGTVRFESGIECKSLKVDCTSGTVRFQRISADGDVSIKATSGAVRIGDGIDCGNLLVKSSSGTVELTGAVNSDGRVEIEATSGTIRTGRITSGEYNIKSTSGAIRLEGLEGMGTVHASSGGVSCDALVVTGDSQLQSTSGSVKVHLAGSPNIKIEAQTSSGSVKSDEYEFSYNSSGKRASCTLGSGADGTLFLKATSGSVRVN